MKHLRIKTFIRLTVIIVTVLSLTILTGLLVVSFSHNELKEIRNAAKQKSDEIVDVLENEGLEAASSNERLKYKVEDYASDQNGRVMIIGRDYMVLMDSAKANENSYLINDKMMELMKGDTEEVSYDTDDSLVIMTPVKSSDMVVGALIYKASTIEAKNNIKSQVTMSIIVLLIILAVDIIIIRIISARAVKDINDVNEKIMHNALGNLQDRLPEDEGFIEVQVLSENYNDVLEKLSTIDQTRSEFVSNVSHELKTPITSMKVLAESVTQNEAATVDDYKEFMVDIVDEIDRETKIINDLLTLVRTDSKQDEMNFDETDINEMIETIVKTVKPLAKQRGIKLTYDSFREVTARVDAVKLSLAISNLIENAVKYNIDNGWISCSLNADKEFFYIKVADSGVGIPDDAKDRVFDRFYRVDKARSRDTGGTGLGLSITRSIVNAHKGTIKLYSESGKGTTFTVKIPL
ncbi:MAG: GHKL domain-containing protein [Eubacterium sp.]|jgi:signal transduction histidine kinase|nr:GHKL domain-containing protein [Eubacterium sp.]